MPFFIGPLLLIAAEAAVATLAAKLASDLYDEAMA